MEVKLRGESNMDSFFGKVFEIVRRIPKGKVITYGQIAAMIGQPMACRAVGSTVHKNPARGIYPCHRVVSAKGELASAFAFGGREAQKELLQSEGVEVSNSFTVNLEKYAWKPIRAKSSPVERIQEKAEA